jgi:2-phosphosulfolactate phosphatase
LSEKISSTASGQRILEVCLSPALLANFRLEDKVVVVIDIFRASSAICTALAHGVKEIIPIDNLEQAHRLKDSGYIVAAERKGEVVNGFDFGNSPYSFMDEKIRNKSVVLTTTNCTNAILKAKSASELLIGSFLNITSLANYLKNSSQDVLLLCAGWNNNINLEDTVFAGALAEILQNDFHIDCDAAIAAMHLYSIARQDMEKFLSKASHTHRLEHLHLQADIAYCLRRDETEVIPVLNGSAIIALEAITA